MAEGGPSPVIAEGLLLLGGTGSRLRPLTDGINKHLLPVFNKPMLFYPLSTLLLAGARNIFIVGRGHDFPGFKKALESLPLDGVQLTYLEQSSPDGIVDAMLVAKEELSGKPFWMALGDNLLFGPGLGLGLRDLNGSKGAAGFVIDSHTSEQFGTVRFDDLGNPAEIREKAPRSFSTKAIPGLYKFDEEAMTLASEVEPSGRGEKEITALLQCYLDAKAFTIRKLPRGTTWMDMGTHVDVLEAATLVRLFEERSGLRIGDPQEALEAYREPPESDNQS
jgi:glucose-1-phosphate thymidylyltransferase